MTLPGAIRLTAERALPRMVVSDNRRFRILCVVDDFSREWSVAQCVCPEVQ